jgi:hypothetical protein
LNFSIQKILFRRHYSLFSASSSSFFGKGNGKGDAIPLCRRFKEMAALFPQADASAPATADATNTTRLVDVLVDAPRYARLLLVDDDDAISVDGGGGVAPQPPPALPSGLTNLCQGEAGLRHKVLSWEGFLTQPEVAYFRKLVYGAAPEDFGTQYVQFDDTAGMVTPSPAITIKATVNPEAGDCGKDNSSASEESSDESVDSDGDGPTTTLSADTLAMLTAMGLAPQPSSTSASSSLPSRITKNRLRTSSFLRTAWFATGPGLAIFQKLAQRAATMFGLDPTCVEAPQLVCYPGGATYFRAHHDSGRLNAGFDHVYLDRDEHGAAR